MDAEPLPAALAEIISSYQYKELVSRISKMKLVDTVNIFQSNNVTVRMIYKEFVIS
jgi:hypothetical protein